MNEVPFLGDIGYVPAPKSSGWSFTNVLIVALGIIAAGYAIYQFILKPLKSKDLELEKEEVELLMVMEARN